MNWNYKKVPQGSANHGGSKPVTPARPVVSSSSTHTSNFMPETMKVVNSPGRELALTNKIYCSPNDARFFPDFLVLLSNPNVSQVQHVLTVESHPDIADGTLGLNAIQRKNIRVSANDDVAVSSFVSEKGSETVMLTVELEFIKFKGKQETLDASVLSQKLATQFYGQVMTVGQAVSFEYIGTNYLFTVMGIALEGNPPTDATRGMVSKKTLIVFETAGNSGIKIVNQKGGASSNLFKAKDFNFQKLGIGGLDAQFQDIFRRAFASRVFPQDVINKLGIQHVKGMLLFGPPGTGKTLIARQIGKMLNGREPKIVNGPEVLSKFVGETEKNIRDLFGDAEMDQKAHGDQSELHIIIFDEIDAICKSRGTTRDGTGVHDSIVNQLLTKIDGVESLNNILLIGMTNRKDMLDEALLRPGRLEVQIEIGLPDEHGRNQILQIHSSKMRESSFLGADVSLQDLAARTKNFSGAELEGLVKSAVSFALNRQVNLEDLNKPLDEDNIKVTMDDFLFALNEVKPAFGAAVTSLERCRVKSMLDCGPQNAHIQRTALNLVGQLNAREDTPLLSCLLEGAGGSGKTALAATIGLESANSVPFIKIISAETMVGLSESTKCGMINKVFEDAYKSPLSIIILDDIERLLEYVNIGPRFSNVVLQALLVLTKRLPPEGRKLLIIGTTSMMRVMMEMDVQTAFTVTLHVPLLSEADIRRVLKGLNVFTPADLDEAMSILPGQMPIKRLLELVDMSKQGGTGDGDSSFDASDEKVNIKRFRECYSDLTRYSTWSGNNSSWSGDVLT